MSCLSPLRGPDLDALLDEVRQRLALANLLAPASLRQQDKSRKRQELPPSLHLLGVHGLGEQASPDPSEERKDPLGNALDDRRTQPAQTQEIRLRTLDDNLLDTSPTALYPPALTERSRSRETRRRRKERSRKSRKRR